MTSLFAAIRKRAGLGGGRVGPVNHVALGTFCHVATALRDRGLRRWTGPFDWLFSTPLMLAECLADDCATLLDPRHLRSVPAAALTGGAARQCRHPLYEERFGLPTIFNHHDPAGSRADRHAVGRAVRRLRQALDGRCTNTFYMLSERAWPDGEVAAVEAALAARRARSELVVITVEPGAPVAGWSIRPRDGSREIALGTRSRSLGTRFSDPADDALLSEVLDHIAGGCDA